LQRAHRVDAAPALGPQKDAAPIVMPGRDPVAVRRAPQVAAAKPAAGQAEVGPDLLSLIPVQKHVVTAAGHTATTTTGTFKSQRLTFEKRLHAQVPGKFPNSANFADGGEKAAQLAARPRLYSIMRCRVTYDCIQENALSHKTRTLFEGRVLCLGIESVILPNGESLELEIVRHPGGAAVVALDEHRRVCLLHQFRHAAGGGVWAVPAGKLAKN
jgi:hypothetical protein